MAVQTGALTGALRELRVDEAKIQAVLKAISDAQESIEDKSFANGARIEEASFGQSDQGPALGWHHTKAHQIIEDTINGMIEDLVSFQESVVYTTKIITEADDSSATSMYQVSAAVNALDSASYDNQGDRSNRESRNENLNEPAPMTPAGGGA